jgi:hypothetical protein
LQIFLKENKLKKVGNRKHRTIQQKERNKMSGSKTRVEIKIAEKTPEALQQALLENGIEVTVFKIPITKLPELHRVFGCSVACIDHAAWFKNLVMSRYRGQDIELALSINGDDPLIVERGTDVHFLEEPGESIFRIEVYPIPLYKK